MKKIKFLLSIVLALMLAMPVGADEVPYTEQGPGTRTGLLPPSAEYLPEEAVPSGYTFERKQIGSSAYDSGENRAWAEYSTYYFYNRLNETEQKFYDMLMKECLVYMTGGGDLKKSNGAYLLPGIPFEGLDISRAQNIYFNAFCYSNRQFYYLMNGISYDDNCIYPKVYDSFAAEDDRKKATEAMKAALLTYETTARAESSEYAKVRAIHDMIAENVAYNKAAAGNYLPEQKSFSQSVYSAFILKNTVCAGYAGAFAMLCNKLGIDSIVEVSDGHAWNRVSVDDIWYVIDCTWDDTDDRQNPVLYTYFLRSYAQILNNDQNNSHIPVAFLLPYLPPCTMDCTPSDEGSTPGVLPYITATASEPELTEADGGFTLSAESGARIYYTIGGVTPSEGQNKSCFYSGPVTAANGSVIKAYAVVDPKLNSPVRTWVLGGTVTPTPVITPVPTTEPLKADETILIGDKIRLKAAKKIAVVTQSDNSIVKIKKKGKKLIVTGTSAGAVTITAYSKNGKLLKSWIVEVKDTSQNYSAGTKVYSKVPLVLSSMPPAVLFQSYSCPPMDTVPSMTSRLSVVTVSIVPSEWKT